MVDFDFSQPAAAEQSNQELVPVDSYEQFLKGRNNYINQVKMALDKIRAVVITHTTDPTDIIDTQATVMRFGKAITKLANERKRPHQDLINEVNKAIKPIKDVETILKAEAKNKLKKIQHAKSVEHERKRREAEEADRRLQDAVKKEAEALEQETGKPVEVPEIPKTAVKPEKIIRTEAGATQYTKKDVEVEVVDLEALAKACIDPKDKRINLVHEGRYVLYADEKYLKDLFKAGRRDIPGVKFTEVEDVIVRS